MFDALGSFLDRSNLSPHGICLLWRPELIWTHVVSDFVTGVSYFTIPVAMGVFLIRRRDVAFGWMGWAFAFFILACGATHFLAIWTLWVPDYAAEALLKAFTGIGSFITAIVLWSLLPRAVALPSPEALRRANAELVDRIRERDAALDALRTAIADRERAEEMLRQTQKMEAIGALTGGVAHDFNNLLGVVIANLDRLARFPLESGAERARSSALTGAERAASLVQKMLAFARRQPLQPTCFDANQLENVLLNLAVNARDAMPEGGRATIRTRNVPAAEAAARAGLPAVDHILISVTDQGCGMSPEVSARAFEPFFTTKAVGEGTGLGLSQAFGFAKQSGGHILLDSRPGHGTTVEVYLPRDRDPAVRPASRVSEATAPPPFVPASSFA